MFPDAAQGGVYLLQLEAQLLGIVHMQQIAAAAAAESGAGRLPPRRGQAQGPLPPAVDCRGAHLYDPDLPALPGQGPGHEHRPAAGAAYAVALGGVALDIRGKNLIFH